jgi:glutaredoxin
MEDSFAMLSRLLPWRKSGPKIDLSHVRVTLYTRQNCGCCHKALETLHEYRHRYRFTIDEVDIDADPELVALYNTTVPVVAVDGKVRFKGVVNRVLLERLLSAHAR